jgi:RNA polymerase sigma-70 factor (ECF subfamily)
VDELTDGDLMVASARGETAAFEELYRRHVEVVVRFAVRRARTPEEVVDLVAAVWLEVIASLDRFRPDLGEPLPWIPDPSQRC